MTETTTRTSPAHCATQVAALIEAADTIVNTIANFECDDAGVTGDTFNAGALLLATKHRLQLVVNLLGELPDETDRAEVAHLLGVTYFPRRS